MLLLLLLTAAAPTTTTTTTTPSARTRFIIHTVHRWSISCIGVGRQGQQQASKLVAKCWSLPTPLRRRSVVGLVANIWFGWTLWNFELKPRPIETNQNSAELRVLHARSCETPGTTGSSVDIPEIAKDYSNPTLSGLALLLCLTSFVVLAPAGREWQSKQLGVWARVSDNRVLGLPPVRCRWCFAWARL